MDHLNVSDVVILIFKNKWAFKLPKCLFEIFKLTHLEFYLYTGTVIDHLKVLDEIEIGDLDLQGLESSNVRSFLVHVLNLTFKIELCSDQLNVSKKELVSFGI